jgi:pantoate--beta-alanine ligase
MYPPDFQTWVEVEKLSEPMEGAARPAHFRGVATVVAKLLNIVQPSRAYFGQKDFQQMRIIQRMVEDLNMPFAIVPCPTVREPGGLAMSSRNAYLSPTEKQAANGISRALRAAAELLKFPFDVTSARALKAARRILRSIPGGHLEYAEAVDADTLQRFTRSSRRAVVAAALRLGPARLISRKK